MDRLRKQTGLHIPVGGHRQFIVIDESHFWHKRMASAIIITRVKLFINKTLFIVFYLLFYILQTMICEH